MAAFDYNQSNINALESTLSVERFRTYVQLAGGNRRRAVDIYERNTAISEALYGVMQATEVALSNAIHRAMTDGYGSMWFEAPSLALEPPQLEKLGKAKSEIQRDKRPLTPGAIVAELGLGVLDKPACQWLRKAPVGTAFAQGFPPCKGTSEKSRWCGYRNSSQQASDIRST
ncbi:MAG: hypothetical protein IT162_04685 [Bryobacterales bacterium]|nr:hypothetical protein [Bryobacterales bacterium]